MKLGGQSVRHLSCKLEDTYCLDVIVEEKLELYNKAHSNYQHQMTQMPKNDHSVHVASV